MNNDLIRRGELLENAELLIKVARAMAGNNKVCNKAVDLMQQTIVELSKAMPAVDAVEVVRCGACKHSEEQQGCDSLYCRFLDTAMGKADFCSYGERRKDDAHLE